MSVGKGKLWEAEKNVSLCLAGILNNPSLHELTGSAEADLLIRKQTNH